MESAFTDKNKCLDVSLQGCSQVGLLGCPLSSAPQLLCGQALSFSSPAPGDPCTQRGFLPLSSFPLLLPLSPMPLVTSLAPEGPAFLRGGNGLVRGAGAGAQHCTLPFPEHTQYDAFCPVFCLFIIVFFFYFFFFYEKPKRVQLSVIPALWVVDPRGDIIAGSSPT